MDFSGIDFFSKRGHRVELFRKKVKIVFLVTNPVLPSCIEAAAYLLPGEQAAWRAPVGLSCPGGYPRTKRLKVFISLKLVGQEKHH